MREYELQNNLQKPKLLNLRVHRELLLTSHSKREQSSKNRMSTRPETQELKMKSTNMTEEKSKTDNKNATEHRKVAKTKISKILPNSFFMTSFWSKIIV